MSSDADASPTHDEPSVVLASFAGRHAAERMLATLGRSFRKRARKAGTTAFVVSANEDGSLEITESRVLSAGDFSAAVIRVTASISLGFAGFFGALKGLRGGVDAGRRHHGHVGSDEQRAHDLLAEVGPHAALALVRCEDDGMREMVATRASERAVDSWNGPLTEFLSRLDPSSKHDWVRTALGEPSADG